MSNSRFEISNVNILTSSSFNISLNQDCTICRCNLNESSVDFQNKGTESNIVLGQCGHAYHEECVCSWIQTNKICPICGNNWKCNTVKPLNI